MFDAVPSSSVRAQRSKGCPLGSPRQRRIPKAVRREPINSWSADLGRSPNNLKQVQVGLRESRFESSLRERPHASGAYRLVDRLHTNDVTIIDMVVDRIEFCRFDLKKPPVPFSWTSFRGDGLANCGVTILCQRPHRSFHRSAVPQSYHVPHLLPRLPRSRELPMAKNDWTGAPTEAAFFHLASIPKIVTRFLGLI
jgi:hypothetical protein